MPSIELETIINAPMKRCFELSRSIDLHTLSVANTKEKAIKGVVNGLIDIGDSVCWQAYHFGLPLKLTSKITVFDSPHHFADEMQKGPFQSFRHDHYFSENQGNTIMKDVFCYKSPLGVLGKMADLIFLENYMRKFLIQRNDFIKQVAESDQWIALLKIEKRFI